MMHLSLCTISFRHHLISLPELATFAARSGLDGIELWAAHARHLRDQPGLNGQWLKAMNLDVAMLSDYLPFQGPLHTGQEKLTELCELAQHWGTRKLRIFAGQTASADASAEHYQQLVMRLQQYCQQAHSHGCELLLETHPDTFADTTQATLKLLGDVNHAALKVNLDVLHIWEAHEDPVKAWHLLSPYVHHLHFKNISRRELLPVFAPANVYSAAGDRSGLVPLFEGAYDYQEFINKLPRDRVHSASLEWFGPDPQWTIAHDTQKIRALSSAKKCLA
ncbi:sugar phosphate isomerase/epimerase family protein [Gilvimarinus chinensis]|uniref:sugar phosphate isomerase/epimerase family protein n=1 Tax=Gilvimarinus chinensis TaxID=396005 RepID=UPI00035E2251|nr:TIM barrel protein [Gilvimarinus chinensis]